MYATKVTLLILMLVIPKTGTCQSERLLDLTKLDAPRNDEPPHSISGYLGGCIDHGEPCIKNSPLKITLLTLDKDSYYWGARVVAEIRLENSSDAPIALPWSRDSRVANPGASQPKSLLVASLVPKIDLDSKQKRTSGTDGWMDSSVLFGSTDQPGTFIILQPRETARIRFASRVSPKNQPHTDFPFELAVRVEMSFTEGPLSYSQNYRPAVSENSITITVREKP